MSKLKLMTILGTRPEIIKMSAIIKKCDKYFDHVLVHTGQNYDYTLNEVFFKELGLREPDYYLGVVGENLGFDFPLTMHVARHSFAVYALNNEIDMSVVSRLLGHSSSVVTERVYAKFLPQTLSDEVAKLHFDTLV